MNQKIEFGRSDTKAIKGIAVLMMLFCHLTAIPDRYPAEFEGFHSIIPGLTESGYFLKFASECGLLCVPFFFFLGGYGLYIRMQKSGFSLKDTILKLYYSYWKIFVIFVPIGLLFFAREGVDLGSYTSKLSAYRGLELIIILITDFLGLSCNLNGEWWFFSEYVCILPLGYLFVRAIRKNQDFWVDYFLVILVDALLRGIVPVLPDIPLFRNMGDVLLYSNFMRFNSLSCAFFAGIVMAKYNGVCKIKEWICGIPFGAIPSLIGFGSLFIIRIYAVGENFDIFFIPVMISMLSVLLDSLTVLKKSFAYLGKHSTNMWLCHSFFCFYFLELTQLVYCTQSVLIDFIILIILSLLASVLVDLFYKQAEKWFSRFNKEKAVK